MCARVHFIYRCCHYVEPKEEDFPTWVWVEFCSSFDAESNSCNALWYETGSIAIDDICEDCKEAMRKEELRLKQLRLKEKEREKESVAEKAGGEVFKLQIRGGKKG